MVDEGRCPFCDGETGLVANDLAYARFDRYPVTQGHCLVVPRRHVPSYFEVTSEERVALWKLVEQVRAHLDRDYAPDAYNIGINIGKTAGQTVMHAHIHVIPRYAGDVSAPRGGVRGVIPEKQNY